MDLKEKILTKADKHNKDKHNSFRNATSKSVFKLNTFLANKKVVGTIVVVTSILMLLFLNYILVSLYKISLNGLLNSNNSALSISNVFSFAAISEYKWLYLTAILVIAFLEFKLCYNIRTSYKEFPLEHKGNERWTTKTEIVEQYKAVPLHLKEFEGYGGIPVSRIDNKWYIDDSPVNSLISGITRSGKGEMMVFPMIDIHSRSSAKPSMVINDPKLELYPACKETLEKRGYKVLLLNLIDPIKSMGYNPLQLIIDAYKSGDYDDAEMLAKTLAVTILEPDKAQGDNAMFVEAAVDCMCAMILALTEDCLKEDNRINAKLIIEHKKKLENFKKAKITDEQRNLILIGRKAYKLKQQGKNKGEIIQFLGINGDVDSAIKKWVDVKDKFAVDDTDLELCNENEKKINMFSLVQMFDKLSQKKYQNGDTDIDKYFELRPSLDRAKLKYTSIKTAPGRTKGGVFIETLHKLVVFTYGKISKMTAESSIDIKEIGFGEKPLAIFIGLPDYDKSFYFIASLFISQTYFVLSKNATFSSSGKCSRRVIFILDEFGNMPAIPNMDSVMTVCLGRNIIFNLIIQSYNQIKTKYGEAYDTIVGNCGNQVYIATADKETATLFSELIGNHTITTINRTGNKMELGKHFTEMYEEEPLINKNQLMDLKEGECVIKRVMKRTDLKGNKITPTPIFNSIKTGTQYPYRYQYMIEEFPTKSFLEVKLPSCVHIKRQKIIYDAAKGLERAEARKNGYPSFNLGVDRLISELDEDTIEQLKIIYNEHEALLSDDFETVGEMHIYDFITIAAQALEKEKLDKSVMSYIIDLVA